MIHIMEKRCVTTRIYDWKIWSIWKYQEIFLGEVMNEVWSKDKLPVTGVELGSRNILCRIRGKKQHGIFINWHMINVAKTKQARDGGWWRMRWIGARTNRLVSYSKILICSLKQVEKSVAEEQYYRNILSRGDIIKSLWL